MQIHVQKLLSSFLTFVVAVIFLRFFTLLVNEVVKKSNEKSIFLIRFVLNVIFLAAALIAAQGICTPNAYAMQRRAGRQQVTVACSAYQQRGYHIQRGREEITLEQHSQIYWQSIQRRRNQILENQNLLAQWEDQGHLPPSLHGEYSDLKQRLENFPRTTSSWDEDFANRYKLAVDWDDGLRFK